MDSGFVSTGTWHKGNGASGALVDLAANISGTTKLYPGAIAESVTDLEGTWIGEKKKSDGTISALYTFTIDVAVDESGKVTGVTVTHILEEAGKTPVTYESVGVVLYKKSTYSEAMQLYFKYYKSATATSTSAITINYENGKFTYSSTEFTKVQ